MRFGANRVIIALRMPKSNSPAQQLEFPSLVSPSRPPATELELRFDGAVEDSTVEALDPVLTRTNYYSGRDPARWHTGIPNYNRIRYSELYPGIDLLFHGERGSLEYDFVIAPGSSPNRIRMSFRGSQGVSLDRGVLRIKTGDSELRFLAPAIYQDLNGVRTKVAGKFLLLANDAVGFSVGRYDRSLPLIIDPVLSYATMLGEGINAPVGIGMTASGQIYLAGESQTGPFVAEVTPAGTTYAFISFLPSGVAAGVVGIAIDAQQNLYVAGNTMADFATTPGAFRTSCPQPSTGCPFVTKFGPDGTVRYSTLLSPGSLAKAIAVDALGDAYITGFVQGPGLDIVNAFQAQNPGSLSAFVQKLNPSGTALEYSTYLAGTAGPTNNVGSSMGFGIAVDSTGSAYVTGQASPASFPTQNISSTLNSNRGIFVVKFKPDGSDLQYADSISGSGNDTSAAIAVDSAGNAYVAGTVTSLDFPTTSGAYLASCVPVGQSPCPNPNQALAMKISADGNSLVYATLLGTGTTTGVTVDPASGHAFLVGAPYQTNFPMLNAIETSDSDGIAFPATGFVVGLDSLGTPMFSTLVGNARSSIGIDPAAQHLVVGGGGAGAGPSNSAILLDNLLPQPNLAVCCDGYIATLDLAGTGPRLSVYPRYPPYLTVRNVGAAPLNISNFSSNPSAVLGGDCLQLHPLAPGTGCSLVAGEQGADFALIVTSDAPGSPQSFDILTKNGVGELRSGERLVASTSQLYFPNQLIGTSSAPQSIRLTNLGDAPSLIVSIAVDDNSIVQTNDCPSLLASATTCTIQVTYSPTASNSLGGTVTIGHDVASEFIRISAGGNPTTNALIVSTQSIQFGTQFVGPAPLPRTVVIANASTAPVSLTGTAVTGPYSQTNNCPPVLAANASCRYFVSFNPSTNGEIPGAMTISHNSVGGSQTLQLDGTGLIRSDLSVSPLQIAFLGNALIGIGASQTLTLQNTSSQTITLNSVTASPAVFSIGTNTCPTMLLSGASCTVVVVFLPTVEGSASGLVTINHTGMGSPQLVPISGAGSAPLGATPEILNFGDQQMGTTGVPFFESLRNFGASPVTISSASASGDFRISSPGCTLPAQLNQFLSCAFGLTFTPSALGTRTGTLTVVASDLSTPHSIQLVGNGVSAGLEISPASLDFGNVAAGSASAAQTLTISDISGGAISLQSISVPPPFQQTNNCGSTLALGGSCAVQISFSPSLIGSASGALSVQNGSDGHLYTGALSGTGTGAPIKVSAGNLLFDNRTIGTTSPARTFTVTNQLASAISISYLLSGDFMETDTCGFSLASAGTCTVSVSFRPTLAGLRSGTLSIINSGPGGPLTVDMSGVGTVAPILTISPLSIDLGATFINQFASSSVDLSITAAPLAVDGIALAPSPSPFTALDLCSPGIVPPNQCFISIDFRPTSLGAFSATLRILDDAAHSPQMIPITGFGTNYKFSSNGATLTLTAGQTATFDVVLASLPGTTDTISFSCAGAPALSTCTTAPPVTLNGGTQTVQVSVTTSAHTAAILTGSPLFLPIAGVLFAGVLGCLMFLWIRETGIHSARPSGVARAIRLASVITLVAGILSCGGSGGSAGGGTTGPPAPQGGTPAGQYMITVTSSSSNSAAPQEMVQLTFIVQ
ncbi:MAG TPA: choice-of-anchor D domain-containing protein [Bryobacteraceae bacterium]|nr:choice-of-anchor D domain-containing protein [Bryobacteraceae bacterium]